VPGGTAAQTGRGALRAPLDCFRRKAVVQLVKNVPLLEKQGEEGEVRGGRRGEEGRGGRGGRASTSACENIMGAARLARRAPHGHTSSACSGAPSHTMLCLHGHTMGAPNSLHALQHITGGPWHVWSMTACSDRKAVAVRGHEGTQVWGRRGRHTWWIHCACSLKLFLLHQCCLLSLGGVLVGHELGNGYRPQVLLERPPCNTRLGGLQAVQHYSSTA